MRNFILGLATLALTATLYTPASEAFTRLPAPAVAQADNAVVLASTARQPASKFRRAKVKIETREKPGTVIIDTHSKYLYLVEKDGNAIRYGVGVGRDGFGWSGTVKVGRKAEWPSWTPPARMVARERAKGRNIPRFMKGGPNNPLGARALYLYRGGRDTIYRIHGTNQPWTIGLNMSSGCIRMMNKDVEHLYKRAGVGTKVIVIGPGRDSAKYYKDKGVNFFANLFGS